MTLGQPIAERNSVINHWLTTATNGRNCRTPLTATFAIGARPILYTTCRELPYRRGNCQGMLDSSKGKEWTEKPWGDLS